MGWAGCSWGEMPLLEGERRRQLSFRNVPFPYEYLEMMMLDGSDKSVLKSRSYSRQQNKRVCFV
jgi:hypothetical protein